MHYSNDYDNRLSLSWMSTKPTIVNQWQPLFPTSIDIDSSIFSGSEASRFRSGKVMLTIFYYALPHTNVPELWIWSSNLACVSKGWLLLSAEP
jgi:hypothetical protein